VPSISLKTEFRLSLGRGEKPRALTGSFHCACTHSLKNAIHAEGIEQIFGFAVRIAGSLQVLETADTPDFKVLIRLKSADNRKGNLEIVPPSLYCAVAAHLIDDPVKHHHFPVEMFKGSETEVAVGE